MTQSVDVIIVGGGHNGLTAGSYLAKAGLSTLILEASPAVGGMTSTNPLPKRLVDILKVRHVMVTGISSSGHAPAVSLTGRDAVVSTALRCFLRLDVVFSFDCCFR